MATKPLTGTYVRSFSSNGYYVNLPYFGRIKNSNTDTTCTICFKLALPQGRVNKLTFTIGVKNNLASATMSGAQYGIKLSTTDNVEDLNPSLTDGTLSLNGVIPANGYGTVTGSIGADKLTDYGGKTIYVYLGAANTDSWSAISLQSLTINLPASDVSVEVEYDEYTKVTSPSIVNTSTIIKPTSDITIRWSGASDGVNNNIKSLSLTLRKQSTSGTILYSETGISPTATSLTIANDDWANDTARGDKIYATIQAIGAVSGFDGTKNSKHIATINQLPSAPSVTASGSTIKADTNITFTVAKGTDPDGQSTTIWYKLGSSGTKMQLSGNTLTYTIDSNLPAGLNTIYFYTRDTLGEESSATSKTFEVIYKPEIETVSVSLSQVNNGLGEKKLTTSLSISYTLKHDLTDISFEFSTGGTDDTLTALSHKVNATAKTIAVDILSSIALTRGVECSLYIRAISNNQKSDWKGLPEKIIRPKLPKQVEITDNNEVKGFFNNNLNLSLKNPSAETYTPDIASIQIRAEYGGSIKEFAASKTSEGTSYTQNLALNVPANTSVKITAILTDVAGQTSVSDAKSFTQAAPPTFASGIISLNPNSVKPLGGGQVAISHPIATSNLTDGIVTYSYAAGERSLKIKNNGSDISHISVITTQLATDLGTDNVQKQISVVITAKDSLDLTASISTTLTVDFREAPSLTGTFTIEHDYTINPPATITSNPEKIVNKNDYNNSPIRMFNPGESVIFHIPKATDANGDSDIKEYQIFMDKQAATSTSDPTDDNWSVSTSPILTVNSDAIYARYIIPATSKNEYLRFRVRARDTTNLASDDLTSTYITRCRVVAPVFAIDNINISGTSLTYDFTLKDLGGSASGAYNKSYYDYFNNFERSDAPGNKKIELKIEVSETSDFSEIKKSLTISTTENFSDFTSNGGNLGENFIVAAKEFLRFTLTVFYGNASTASLPLSTIFYGSVPTVSHRAHHIGINTNIFGNEDVLVVESYGNYKTVVLKSISNSITINLETGAIFGATISGGEWS